MATARSKTSSFSRNLTSTGAVSHIPGIKHGPNGTTFLSSGIPDLDKILGGGFPLGSLVMIMEDAEAPHHLLLLRTFMSQGLVHEQPLLYASPSRDPRAFLGTLPSPLLSKEEKTLKNEQEQEKGLRIAWQYKKYFGENQPNLENSRDTRREYCSEFDLRKPMERHLFSAKFVECVSTLDSSSLAAFRDSCSRFLEKVPRNDVGVRCAGRIAIQSLCAPQCGYFNNEWDMVSFIRSLKNMVRSSNAVAVVTFPPSLISLPLSKRLQHLADTLLSVRAIPDEDKEMSKLLTGYQDMVGLLHVHKVAQINTQVPVILEASTFSIKLQRRRSLVLERLNQAPVDGSSGTSYNTSTSCSGSSKASPLDF
ncbi:hypothetical protein Scep_018483 [Stephania cephalantha]|uniref:Elongator complex protein 4 n=1 Tax=Stephania cephalantha TaxID=152367 RepID=A0AAP0NLV3_9MAGN